MKKNLLFAAALATGFLFAKPEAKAQGISVGPRIGLNFSQFGYSDASDEAIKDAEENRKMLTGINGGIVFNIGVNDMFSVQPELLYSGKGTKLESSEDAEAKYENTLNYLEVPVLAKFSFGSEDFKFFINAGPSISYAIGGKHKISGGVLSFEEDVEFDYSEAEDKLFASPVSKFNRLDVGLVGGAGIGINAGPGMFTLEGRYGYGLSDVIGYKEKRDEETPKASNRTIGVSVSYMFPLGK